MKKNLSQKNKRFNYLFGELNAVYHEIALKFELSDSAMQILYMICDYDGSCLLRDICRLSGLSKQTVNSAIRKLERENIIVLDKTQNRFKMVRLTDNGKSLVDKTALRVIDMEISILSSWTNEEVEKYLELTEKYLNDLKDKYQNL